MPRQLLILAALAVLAGLTAFLLARGGRDASSPGGPVPAREVPPTSPPPPLLDTWLPPPVADRRLAILVDRRRPTAERLAVIQEGGLVLGAEPRDRAALLTVLGDAQDGDTERNEVANLLAQVDEPRLVSTLLAVIDATREGPRFRSFAVQHLGLWYQAHRDLAQATAIAERLRELLDHPEVPSRREALLALARGRDPVALDETRRLLGDPPPDPAMTDLALRIAGEQQLRDCLAAVRRLATIEPPAGDRLAVTAVAAVHALAVLGDDGDRPLLERLAAGDHEPLRRAATAALARLES